MAQEPRPASIHTVDLLEEAILVAERSGYLIRRLWLAEGVGGPCRVGAQRVLFVNLANSTNEQLALVIGALRSVVLNGDPSVSEGLKRLLA